MSKRRNSSEAQDESTSKRPRINAPLVEIYEKLADEAEDTRIEAAYDLLTKHFPAADDATVKQILRRLFRGLCSSRKAARAGFYVALVSALAESRRQSQSRVTIPLSEILDILETESKPEGLSTGQDERDHHFGRLYGCKAIIDSKILFDSSYLSSWRRLLDLICGIAVRKPWLRQECGWTLYSCINPGLKELNLAEHAISILEQLIELKLMRTQEGVAIWIAVQSTFPKTKLPKNVWKGNNPLSNQDVQILATMLKDSSTKDDAEFEVQASTTWNAQLHFVWDILLKKFYHEKGQGSHLLDFASFWQSVVDQGIFALTSSAERKHSGLLLLRMVIEDAPVNLLEKCFTPNAVSCLIKSLKTGNAERYLQRTAQTVADAMLSTSERVRIPLYISGLLRGCGFADFDSMTKTKTIEQLFNKCDVEGQHQVAEFLIGKLIDPEVEDPEKAKSRRRDILGVHQRFINQLVVSMMQAPNGQEIHLDVLEFTLFSWLTISRNATQSDGARLEFSEITMTLIKEKLSYGFESVLKLGRDGIFLFLSIVSKLKEAKFEADDAVRLIVRAAWVRFGAFKTKVETSSVVTSATSASPAQHNIQTKRHLSAMDGVALLYSLLLYQAYTDDTEAVTIIQDLLELEVDGPLESGNPQDIDQAMEVLLSFASRPSKFLRRIILLIFEAFSPQISAAGLESLMDILATKETKEGQEELFEAEAEVDDGEDSEGSESAQDDGSDLDSDVEVVDASDAASSDDATSQGSIESDSKDDEISDDQKDASEALERALASALGTRKLTSADAGDEDDESTSESESGSDSDMTDSEMLALDSKLSEVFRNKLNQSANQKHRKDEIRSAKTNIVNFKNRVLDMVEVFLRNQSSKPESLMCILPLMKLSRTTSTKQLSTRALDILKTFAGKCKRSGVPKVGGLNEDPSIYGDLFSSIHNEIQHSDASNALIATANQMNILVSKVLLNANLLTFEQVVKKVDGIHKKLQDEAGDGSIREAHKEFFANFDQWKKNRMSGSTNETSHVAQNKSKSTTSTNGTAHVATSTGSKKKAKAHKAPGSADTTTTTTTDTKKPPQPPQPDTKAAASNPPSEPNPKTKSRSKSKSKSGSRSNQ